MGCSAPGDVGHGLVDEDAAATLERRAQCLIAACQLGIMLCAHEHDGDVDEGIT